MLGGAFWSEEACVFASASPVLVRYLSGVDDEPSGDAEDDVGFEDCTVVETEEIKSVIADCAAFCGILPWS